MRRIRIYTRVYVSFLALRLDVFFFYYYYYCHTLEQYVFVTVVGYSKNEFGLEINRVPPITSVPSERIVRFPDHSVNQQIRRALFERFTNHSTVS